MIMDAERSAELEGNTPGIHSVYHLEKFHQNWFDQAFDLAQFVGLDPNSPHTKAGIKNKPDNLLIQKSDNPQLSLLEKCNYGKTVDNKSIGL